MEQVVEALEQGLASNGNDVFNSDAAEALQEALEDAYEQQAANALVQDLIDAAQQDEASPAPQVRCSLYR